MNMAGAKKPGDAPAAPAYGYANRKPADIIRELLVQAGLSQRQGARELGVDERTMRYWCAGEHDPPRMAILALERLADMQREVRG